MKKLLSIIFLIFTLAICVQADELGKTRASIKHSGSGWFIYPGMSKIELLRKVGEPDSKTVIQHDGDVGEEWIYKDSGGYITVHVWGSSVGLVRKDY